MIKKNGTTSHIIICSSLPSPLRGGVDLETKFAMSHGEDNKNDGNEALGTEAGKLTRSKWHCPHKTLTFILNSK